MTTAELIAHAQRTGNKRLMELAHAPAKAAKPITPRLDNGGYRSGLERRYAEYLRMQFAAGNIQWWKYEPVKLRLADGLTYSPDFMLSIFGAIVFDEVKGFERDDATAKFKMAAETFPFWRFRMVKADGRAWKITRDLGKWVHEEFSQ